MFFQKDRKVITTICNQEKQARLQSLYQCDKIIYLPVFLLNVKGDTEVALKQREGSALWYR
jgi:hypothetical protein